MFPSRKISAPVSHKGDPHPLQHIPQRYPLTFQPSNMMKKAYIHNTLQIYLNNLNNYFNMWGLSINPKKPNASYSIKVSLNLPLTSISKTPQFHGPNITYFGITLDNRLSLKKVVSETRGRALHHPKLLYPILLFCEGTNEASIKIYKAFIRPIITYGSPIFEVAKLLS